MRLVVNGKEREVPSPLTAGGLLEYLDVNPLVVAVEVNGEVLRRGTFDQCQLREGDRVEVVRMIGGGTVR